MALFPAATFEFPFVTGFTKTVLIGTRNEIHFIADYETYTLALPENTKHIAIDSQVCFH